jgi:hypothetical protein
MLLYFAAMSLPIPATIAEQSAYRATSRHADVLAFIGELARLAPGLIVDTMGKSGLGQDIPVLRLGAAAATPETAQAAARSEGRPVVLVLANIHAGEVEGKESVLALAREIALGPLAHLAEQATLLLVPDYNPDGNDRIDVTNRALDLATFEGQIGPEGGVGTRNTAQGYNLNRDYVKLAAIESRHLARLYGTWRPHLTIDCHTTNGSLHGYHLTYDTAHLLPSSPRAPILYVRDTLLPAVSRQLEANTGFRTFFYGNFRHQEDPTQGWETYPGLPRFGSHYRGLTGRMDILLEAYSYISFRERCAVMQATLTAILEHVAEHGAEMVEIVHAAETETVARGRHPDPQDFLGVSYAQFRARRDSTGATIGDTGSLPVELSYPIYPLGEPVEILSWDAESLRTHAVPGKTLTTYRAPHYARFVPTKVVSRPYGYLLPASCERIAEHLLRHNLAVHVVEAPATVEVEVEAFVVDAIGRTSSRDIAADAPPETLFFGHCELERYPVRPGDFLVLMAQPFGCLAAYLLEPESDDGLIEWGFFPDVTAGSVYPVRRILQATAIAARPWTAAPGE